MALSFATDIRPLFRDEDITCMDGSGVHLDDFAWMCVPANAQSVYEQVSTGAMPPDEPWSSDQVSLLKKWMGRGLSRLSLALEFLESRPCVMKPVEDQ